MYKEHPEYKDEVAVLNKNTGEYEITYMGIASPNEASEFQYTAGLWFTDRFHHIVARGLTNEDLDPDPEDGYNNWGRAKSSVRKIVYGEKVINCPPEKKTTMQAQDMRESLDMAEPLIKKVKLWTFMLRSNLLKIF